jgi:hypothetical protein
VIFFIPIRRHGRRTTSSMMKPKIEFLHARAYGAEGVRLGSFSTEMACPRHVCFPPDSDHSADIWGGPFRAISEVGPALFNRFGGAHRVAPGSIDTPGLLTHP